MIEIKKFLKNVFYIYGAATINNASADSRRVAPIGRYDALADLWSRAFYTASQGRVYLVGGMCPAE